MDTRRADVDDLDELLALMRAYCDFYDAAPSDASLRELSRTLLADPDSAGVQLLATDADGRAIGFATIYWSYATTLAAPIGVMNDLFVAPSARGSGAAQALISACQAECARHGARRLTWQTAPDNKRAQTVYDRVGGRREQWIDYWLPV
jgi:GNAT superfamily N-acetyltransferase